jgi:hypothetical protein
MPDTFASNVFRVLPTHDVSTGTMPTYALGGVKVNYVTDKHNYAHTKVQMQWRNMSTQVTTGGDLLSSGSTEGLWPWGPKEILDCKGNKLATFTTTHFHSEKDRSRIKYRYYLNDAKGNQLAMSTPMSTTDTSVSFIDANTRKTAVSIGSHSRLDAMTVNVKILDDKATGLIVDPAVLVYLATNRVLVWQAITEKTKNKNNNSYKFMAFGLGSFVLITVICCGGIYKWYSAKQEWQSYVDIDGHDGQFKADDLAEISKGAGPRVDW